MMSFGRATEIGNFLSVNVTYQISGIATMADIFCKRSVIISKMG